MHNWNCLAWILVISEQKCKDKWRESQREKPFSRSTSGVQNNPQVMPNSCFSHIWFFVTSQTVAHQAPLCLGFSRQEYGSGLLFPPPGDLHDPGTEPTSLTSPALAGGFFTTSATWEALTEKQMGREAACQRRQFKSTADLQNLTFPASSLYLRFQATMYPGISVWFLPVCSYFLSSSLPYGRDLPASRWFCHAAEILGWTVWAPISKGWDHRASEGKKTYSCPRWERLSGSQGGDSRVGILL